MKLKPGIFVVAEPRSEEDLAKDKEFWDSNPPVYRCYDCGSTEGFTSGQEWSGEHYTTCNKCSSENTCWDGEGSPICDCGAHFLHGIWWCQKCNKAMCAECWEWFDTTEEPEDNLCVVCT